MQVLVHNEPAIVDADLVEGRVELVACQFVAAFELLDGLRKVLERDFAVLVAVHVGKRIIKISEASFKHLFDTYEPVRVKAQSLAM